MDHMELSLTLAAIFSATAAHCWGKYSDSLIELCTVAGSTWVTVIFVLWQVRAIWLNF